MYHASARKVLGELLGEKLEVTTDRRTGNGTEEASRACDEQAGTVALKKLRAGMHGDGGRLYLVVVVLLVDGSSVSCTVGSGLAINNLLNRLFWLGSVRCLTTGRGRFIRTGINLLR